MILKNILVITCFGILSVSQVQANVSAYDKISGAPSLSVLSSSSLQSATSELSYDVVELKGEVTDLSISVEDLSSDLEELEDSYSNDSSEMGGWYYQGYSSSVDDYSEYPIRLAEKSLKYNYSDSAAASIYSSDYEDVDCVIGTTGHVYIEYEYDNDADNYEEEVLALFECE